MRIRKNAKLSSLLQNPSTEDHHLQPLVCQLNQSPWDVISRSPTSFYSPFQFEREGSPTGTWSSLNCPAPSLESTLAVDDIKMAFIDGDDQEENNVKEENITTKKKKKKQTDANGDYQLVKCSSTIIEGKNDNAVRNKGSNRRARKKPGGSNPHEFYYYSGFGPSWGKRRGLEINNAGAKDEGQYRNLCAATEDKSSPTPQTTPSYELGQAVYEDSMLDAFDEEEREFDDDDDVEECGGGKRRMRKPVKARSLKSLM